LKILLIEDNANHVTLITRSLKKKPSQIHSVSTALEATQSLKKKKIDMVLMDYYLKGTSTLELLKLIHQSYPQIPIIVITGNGDERVAAKSIKAGAEDYVVKTREALEMLPELIEKTLRKHARKKTKPKKQPPLQRGISFLFTELEQVSQTLKNLSQTNSKTLQKKALREIKKIPLLNKKMEEMKKKLKKLFLRSQ